MKRCEKNSFPGQARAAFSVAASAASVPPQAARWRLRRLGGAINADRWCAFSRKLHPGKFFPRVGAACRAIIAKGAWSGLLSFISLLKRRLRNVESVWHRLC